MKRAGLLFIVLVAAATLACGGDDSGGSSPTGPSSPGGSNPSQPSNPSGGAPTNLTVAVSVSSVTLSWTGVSGASQYQVLVGTSPSSSNTLSTNTTQTNYTWTVGSGTYYARVQAKNGDTFSGSSNEVVFTIS